jgi:asparagine synthetase B (glutamine-hydrolysing)
VNDWPTILPEVDPHGDLGIWVAADGASAAAPVAPDRSVRTLLASGPGRAFRLLLETPAIRPAVATGHGCAVVLDGTLFEKDELRARLGLAPAEIADDAGLVLAGYRRWGRDVLRRMKGWFALVLRDDTADLILCAVDPLGAYPLFYAGTTGEFVASTSVEALLRYPGVSTAPSLSAMVARVGHYPIGRDETFFEAIRRLSAGQMLEVRGGTAHVTRYWDPGPVDEPLRWVREDELAQFDAILERAVARCLDLGRAGVYLSGGIDSVSVAAAAADVSRRRGTAPPLALLMDMSREGADETLIQTAVAERLGMSTVRRHYAELSPTEDTLQQAVDRTSTWPWPLPDPTNIRYLNIGLEGKAHGARVLLTGEGGDEWLAPHPIAGAECLRTGDLAGFWRLLRVAVNSYPIGLREIVRLNLWQSGARAILAQEARRLVASRAPEVMRRRRRGMFWRDAPGWLAPDPAVRRLLEARLEANIERDLAAVQKTRDLYRPQVRGLIEPSFDDDFEKSRRAGVRLLHPFWSQDVVEFLYRTPPRLLGWGDRTKGFVRARLAKRFPGLGFERQRKLLLPAVAYQMIMASGPAVWEKLGGAPTLERLGLVDGRRLAVGMAEAFAQPQTVRSPIRVWHVLNLEAWARPRAS